VTGEQCEDNIETKVEEALFLIRLSPQGAPLDIFYAFYYSSELSPKCCYTGLFSTFISLLAWMMHPKRGKVRIAIHSPKRDLTRQRSLQHPVIWYKCIGEGGLAQKASKELLGTG
jgi:hypothetical protein